ncbi:MULTISPECIES: fumarylacetoacetate hydrolase family protein [unclassified Streptosporangium]|uniref:fumarylacetoacetate hydrolase family protein n=1 Tax=unclassified Streptosporangium TaxID=2632669 RepID=UPI002E2B723C|nr:MULTISPECIES: fumarylacetoacetate hydrolase family protein [unclassified Streptosporangium]
MRFVGFRDERQVRVGVLTGGDRVAPLTEVGEFYDDLPGWTARARELTGGEPGSYGYAPAELNLAPAVAGSARVVCVGLNYRAHAAEGGFPIPETPAIFGRWTASLAVDGTPVPVPPDEAGLDWEVELVAVVGTEMRCVDEETALAGVFGYATFNDLSARRAQRLTAQWTLGKNSDHSGPIGPVVTADEVGDPAGGLRLVTRVNGEVVQDGDTKDMIFSVGRVLAHLSRTMTLRPGDLVATGTPAGVGHARTPARFLRPGDVVEVEIDRLGSVRNPIVAWPES